MNAKDKLPKKRQQWIERTMAVSHLRESEVTALLMTPRQPSLRLNPLKGGTKATLQKLEDLGWKGNAFLSGYTISEGYEAVRDSLPVKNGEVYIQNAASWLPVLALNPQKEEKILDVCAAPGGKAAHIAALTANQAELWVNDNSRARLYKMRANFIRLGVKASKETLYDATQLQRKLDGDSFDKILLDAPCSGEGLMQLSRDKDFATWSVAHIKRLSTLQKRLISQSWQLLKPGGTLVYSTCTMAPEENEAVVDYLLRHNENARIEEFPLELPNRSKSILEWNGKRYTPALANSVRLLPSQRVEAFFVCKLTKLRD